MNDPAVLDGLRWPLEALSLLILLGMVVYLRVQWSNLPAQVPMHFGITGKPDRWHGRWSLILVAGMSLGLYVALSFASGTWRLLTGAEEPRPHEAFIGSWVKMWILAVIAFLLWTMIRVARRQAERLNLLVMIAMIAFAALPAVFGLGKD